MAKPVENFTFADGSNSKYNWAEWADGQTWKLVEGEDYTNSGQLRQAAYQHAKNHGRRAQVSVKEKGVVYLRFSDK